MGLTVRRATLDDLPALQEVVYLSATWDPERPPLPPAELLEMPYFKQFWHGWGRPGDLAVFAEIDAEPMGGALARRFTAESHAHGFVDAETPEVAIGVPVPFRGRGIGTALLGALEEEARGDGRPALSLSVETANPARRLYTRLGYVEVDRDETAVRMVKRLDR